MTLEILLWSNTSDPTAINTFMRNAGWIDASNNPIKQLQIDYVGTLQKTPAVFTGGVMTTPPVAYAGYHCNVRFYGADAAAMITGPTVDGNGNPISIQTCTNLMTAIPTLSVPATAILVVNGPTVTLAGMLKDSTTGVYVYDGKAMGSGVRQRVWA